MPRVARALQWARQPGGTREGAVPQPRPCVGTARWDARTNQEFLVGAAQHAAPNASLQIVHTARRYYRAARARGAPSARAAMK